jgi:hypothetical protein
MVLLNCLMNHKVFFKFKYNTTNTNWVDIDLIIYIVIMNYKKKTWTKLLSICIMHSSYITACK